MKIDAEFVNEIATTIWSQLRGTTNFWVLGSWGISRKAATKVENYPLTGCAAPALALSVNGHLYKGVVKVAYNEGTDTYDIFTKGKTPVMTDVYCDELGRVLDHLIETK